MTLISLLVKSEEFVEKFTQVRQTSQTATLEYYSDLANRLFGMLKSETWEWNEEATLALKDKSETRDLIRVKISWSENTFSQDI